jgi:hypothetical protein
MTQEAKQPTWWDLHLRKARGEVLSEAEQRRYDEEMARQDREAPLTGDIEMLKRMRATAAALGEESAQLRARIERIEKEIQRIEQGLSRQTRELLGVQE